MDTLDGRLSRSDRAAVERAIDSKLGSVSVCCPSGDDVALRYAVAAGACGSVSLSSIQPGLVLFGLGGMGNRAELLPAHLACAHSAGLILEVLEFTVLGSRIDIVRDLGRGEREFLSMSLPVVALMSNSAPTRKYVSRYRQQVARLPETACGGVEIDWVDSSMDDGQQGSWQPFRPRTRTTDLAKKTAAGARDRLFETFGLTGLSRPSEASEEMVAITGVENCVMHLLRYLKHHGLMEPSLITAAFSEPAEMELDGRQTGPMTSNRDVSVKGGQQPINGLGTETDLHVRPLPAAVLRRPRPLGLPQARGIRGPYPLEQGRV